MKDFRAPTLPNPPTEYDKEYMEHFIRNLEVYFGRIDSNTDWRAQSFTGGGWMLNNPYGRFCSTADQTSAGTTSENLFTFNVATDNNNITVENNDEITMSYTGYYLVSVSAVFSNGDSAVRNIDMWVKKAGTNEDNSRVSTEIPDSASNFIVKNSFVCQIDTVSTDFIQLAWWSDSANVQAEHTAADTTPTRPVIPSVSAEVFFLCAL